MPKGDAIDAKNALETAEKAVTAWQATPSINSGSFAFQLDPQSTFLKPFNVPIS